MLDFDDLLVWWAAALAEPAVARGDRRRASTMCWSTSTRTPTACRRRSCSASSPTAAASPSSATTPSRSTRFAPPRCATSSTSPAASRRRREVVTLERNYRSTAPLLAASNAVIALAAERHAKELWSDRPAVERAGDRLGRGRERAGAHGSPTRILALRETGPRAEEPGGAVPQPPSTAPRSSSSWPGATFPFVKYGGLKFLEAAHVKDVLAVLRFAANPRGERAGLRGAAARAGHRRGDRRPAARAMAAAADPAAALLAFVPAPAAAPAWSEFAALFAALRAPGVALAGGASPRSSAGTGRSSSGCTTTPRRAPPTSPTWCGWRRATVARPLPHRARARPAGGHAATSPGPARSTRTT